MQNETDITKLSVPELKALAYDQKVIIEQTQLNLNIIENRIRALNGAAAAREAALAAEAANPKDAAGEPTGDGAQPNGEQPTQPDSAAGGGDTPPAE